MKKRYIPLILACLAVAFAFGLQMGARTNPEPPQEVQDIPHRTLSTIAIVNADAGVELNGIRINYAAAVIDTLGYNFTLVSPAMAQAGLDSGMYSAIVTFPSNVSARILSFNAHMPERVELEFVISPDLSDREFLETFIAITELQLAINTTLANTYVSSILGQFHDAQDHIDGVFQNNLLDLLALEFLTHGDFTAQLNLDYVPHIPLNPQELDREFYMGQVAMFAQEVAGWYLHSYEMASNQFLWMREGLFRLTEDFPDQKYEWLDMLTDWTRLSEEYGELLEIYSAYVRGHDLSLYDWFHENRTWNHALEDFQWHLEGWHDTSAHWFDTWEVWHQDYVGYLDAVIEFREALDAFHGSLDESAVSVINDLEMFLAALEDYEQSLYRQFNVLVETLTIYGAAADDANEFLGSVQAWHGNLSDHYDILSDWQYDVSIRQGEVNTFHAALITVQGELQDIVDGFYDGFHGLPGIPDSPADIDLAYYWAIMDEPIDFPTMYGLPPVPEQPTIVLTGPDTTPPARVAFEFSTLDTSALLLNVPPPPEGLTGLQQIPSVTPLSPPEPFPGMEAVEYLENVLMGWMTNELIPDIIDQFSQGVIDELESAANAAYDEIYNWRLDLIDAVYCPDNGWFRQRDLLIERINTYHEPLDLWHTQLSGLADAIDEWSNAGGILDTAIGQLEDWELDLDGFYTQWSAFHGNVDSFMTYELKPRQDALDTIRKELFDWYGNLLAFKYGTYCYDGVDYTHGLSDIYTALYALYYDLFPVDMPTLPCDEDWDELDTPAAAYIGAQEPFDMLESLPLIDWYEDIFAPDSYDGVDIFYAFSIRFPLEDHAMVTPFDMAPPPQYTGMAAPDTVGDHTMTTALQPLNPMVGAPPQPDNFWHSLNFMHSQVSSFDVSDFLSYDIHNRVDRSLQSYDAFLASLSDDIVHLFSDNILRMYDVHAEYNHFLQDVRHAAFAAQAAEQDALQEAIDEFADARGETSDDNQDRLGTFASMMPESRVAGTVNQELVSFAVSPFDFVPLELREEPAPIYCTGGPDSKKF